MSLWGSIGCHRERTSPGKEAQLEVSIQCRVLLSFLGTYQKVGQRSTFPLPSPPPLSLSLTLTLSCVPPHRCRSMQKCSVGGVLLQVPCSQVPGPSRGVRSED